MADEAQRLLQAERLSRVERLLEAARQLESPLLPAGRALRHRLLETSGLSSASIELALRHCLETQATPADLTALLARAPQAERAHVLLAGNVFVAALRSIALGVAASERVFVRTSRRDPALAEALHALTPDLFKLVTDLQAAPGDRVWAYGTDKTLDSVRASLPAGVWLHRHGHGVGVAVVEPGPGFIAEDAARRIALDAALFDQRGCLSARAVLLVGGPEVARELWRALALELGRLELELPFGRRSSEELAEARRQRDAAAYAFELLDAGSAWVTCSERLVLPPVGRNLHVLACADAAQALAPWAPHLTCIGADVTSAVESQLRSAFPGARLCQLGQMQKPPLDGPVDQRQPAGGELLG